MFGLAVWQWERIGTAAATARLAVAGAREGIAERMQPRGAAARRASWNERRTPGRPRPQGEDGPALGEAASEGMDEEEQLLALERHIAGDSAL